MSFLRALLPHMRGHRRSFALGILAALCVVGARLALPWPVQRLARFWLPGPDPTPASALPGPDPVIGMGALLFLLLVLHGLADMLERFYFARFAIGSVHDLRREAFRRIASHPSAAGRPGDMVARMVGDIARIQVGIKGFLVHVATNGVMVGGVTVVLLVMNIRLGLIFGGAALGTMVVAAAGARRILHQSTRHRKKEGKLADALHQAFATDVVENAFARLNRSSERKAVSITRLIGLITWAAHAIFGVSVLLCLWVGARGIQTGDIAPTGMVVFLLYALMMRGPLVRLARQGARTGKILGAGRRVGRFLEDRPRSPGARAARRAHRPAIRVLFTGYAPVHFLCFRPLFRRLTAREGVEVFVSGGLRTRTEGETRYDPQGMYSPLGVPADRILPVEAIRDRAFDLLFAANTTLIEPGAVAARIQIFHGMSFRNKAVRRENLGCDHYFLFGPYMRRRFAEAELFPPDDPRLVSIGFMKTDPLRNGTLHRGALLRRYGLDGTRPVILYAPTGQKGNSLETFGPEAIGRLAASGLYDILVKAHDHPKRAAPDPTEALVPHLGPRCRVVRDLDVTPLLYLADLLITDASSVSNEYALLDRPILFLDVPEIIDHGRAAIGAMIDETHGRHCGTIVVDPAEINDVVGHCLERPGEQSSCRRMMTEDLFYHPGGATDAAMAWLEAHYLDPTTAAPAGSTKPWTDEGNLVAP